MTNMLLFIILPILYSLSSYILKKLLPKYTVILIPVYLFSMSIFYITTIGDSEIFFYLTDIPLPYSMALRIDRLSSIMLLLNNFLFTCMFIFSLKKEYFNHTFIFLFLSLEGLINGVFLSTDLFNIYVLIEVSTIAVSILIMFKKDSQSMYDGLIYLIVNMVAMAFFLFGVGYLYKYFGVLDLISLKTKIDVLDNPKLLFLPFAFLFNGVGLKAAVMPLYSWLPKAHGTASAPSVVSSILSGIFVKIGVYLIIRMQWLFQSAIDINSILLFLGFFTATAGFLFAMSQIDIKAILAYHTISQVGLIIIGLSGPYKYNYDGGYYHIMAHGIFKALLFLIAGILIHHYKTRDISKMHNLWDSNKMLSIVLIFAVLSITGAPFFSSSYSKYFISKGYESNLAETMFWIINIGTMMSFLKFFKLIMHKPGFKCEKLKLHLNERFVLCTMAAACLFLGIGGDLFSNIVLNLEMHFDVKSQLSKLPAFLLSYLIGIFVYERLLKGSLFIRKIRAFDLSFNSINIAIVIFFFLTLTYLNISF